MLQDLSYEPFKEPRGFLKILQWIFAICAFATTVNFTTVPAVELTCTENGTTVPVTWMKHTISYTFHLDSDEGMPLKECKNFTLPKDKTMLECHLAGNAKSDSEFFVTTGVLSFLYSTGLIAIFLLADKMYTENSRAPIIDFFITVLFAFFWFAGSCAWANGLSGIRTGADPNTWQVIVNSTTDPLGKEVRLCDTVETGYKCDKFLTGEFGGLVISILFGFINFILWATNLWTIYKETSWSDSGHMNNPASGPRTAGV